MKGEESKTKQVIGWALLALVGVPTLIYILYVPFFSGDKVDSFWIKEGSAFSGFFLSSTSAKPGGPVIGPIYLSRAMNPVKLVLYYRSMPPTKLAHECRTEFHLKKADSATAVWDKQLRFVYKDDGVETRGEGFFQSVTLRSVSALLPMEARPLGMMEIPADGYYELVNDFDCPHILSSLVEFRREARAFNPWLALLGGLIAAAGGAMAGTGFVSVSVNRKE